MGIEWVRSLAISHCTRLLPSDFADRVKSGLYHRNRASLSGGRRRFPGFRASIVHLRSCDGTFWRRTGNRVRGTPLVLVDAQ